MVRDHQDLPKHTPQIGAKFETLKMAFLNFDPFSIREMDGIRTFLKEQKSVAGDTVEGGAKECDFTKKEEEFHVRPLLPLLYSSPFSFSSSSLSRFPSFAGGRAQEIPDGRTKRGHHFPFSPSHPHFLMGVTCA